MGGWVGATMRQAVEGLQVAIGEVDNIHDAALRDLATVLLDHLTANWPVDTGYSLSRWRIVDYRPQWYLVECDADYAEWVHHGLADRLAAEFWQAIDTYGVEAFISQRLLELLHPGGGP